jgi:hypothetical protein
MNNSTLFLSLLIRAPEAKYLCWSKGVIQRYRGWNYRMQSESQIRARDERFNVSCCAELLYPRKKKLSFIQICSYRTR